MASTTNARQTAKDVMGALAKRGIKVTLDAKRVRAWVRDNVDAYDDDGYTAHQYDGQTHAAIVKGMVDRYAARAGQTGSNARGTAASAGRKATPRKATSKPAAPDATPDA